MTPSTADEHYESKFEFPLWKLIKQRAEEKDISYIDASDEVLPEYCKTIRYGDKEFYKECVAKRYQELNELYERGGLLASKQREYVEEADREYKELLGG